MAQETPFGKATRMRVLEEYLAAAGEISGANAWEHVYRCLLWMNKGAGLAHIYDSNHMQKGGVFHSRAVRFTELLCERWGIGKQDLANRIDCLFRGCIAELRRRRDPSVEADSELESELTAAIEALLRGDGLSDERAKVLARQIEGLSRDFFTVGNKRKNALGEGFEDLLMILLGRVSNIPADKLALRTPVSKLPGFRRAPILKKGEKREREPHPDIAMVDGGITHVIVTAKWSMRQDRETQFQAEYTSYQMHKVQSTELRFALITNEFDLARLKNVARAMPGGAGGYIFHNIYHIAPDLLRETQGARFKEIEPWFGTGKIQALSDFLGDMRGRFGNE
jgi:hypothetical protein